MNRVKVLVLEYYPVFVFEILKKSLGGNIQRSFRRARESAIDFSRHCPALTVSRRRNPYIYSPSPFSSDSRQGYANGYKPKTIDTRMGKLMVNVPQVRGGVQFYPSALEKGCRSERALKLAIAEMYVQGVSTRRVTDVLEKMCGLSISSTQVSRVAQILDEELEKWRNRSLGEYPYLVLDAHYEKVRS